MVRTGREVSPSNPDEWEKIKTNTCPWPDNKPLHPLNEKACGPNWPSFTHFYDLSKKLTPEELRVEMEKAGWFKKESCCEDPSFTYGWIPGDCDKIRVCEHCNFVEEIAFTDIWFIAPKYVANFALNREDEVDWTVTGHEKL